MDSEYHVWSDVPENTNDSGPDNGKTFEYFEGIWKDGNPFTGKGKISNNFSQMFDGEIRNGLPWNCFAKVDITPSNTLLGKTYLLEGIWKYGILNSAYLKVSTINNFKKVIEKYSVLTSNINFTIPFKKIFANNNNYNIKIIDYKLKNLTYFSTQIFNDNKSNDIFSVAIITPGYLI